MTRLALLVLVLAALSCSTDAAPGRSPAAGHGWKTLEPGLELAVLAMPKKSEVGASQLTALRIDLAHWDLEFVGRSVDGSAKGATAREWCRKHGLVAGINAGMFATDYVTHVGHLRHRGRDLSAHRNTYRSVAAFDPRREELPRFRIFDLDAEGVDWKSITDDYRSDAQNLRLIRRPGTSVWDPKVTDAWSEAALAEDAQGRILFLFCRSPYTMHEFNRQILSLGLGIVAAQHLEGGPEAHIYVRSGGEEIEHFGSFETSFQENDSGSHSWPIPNVLGIRRREVR
jgi:hypothetical protein